MYSCNMITSVPDMSTPTRQLEALQELLSKKSQAEIQLQRQLGQIEKEKELLETLFEGSQAWVSNMTVTRRVAKQWSLLRDAFFQHRENRKCLEQIQDLKDHVKVGFQ